MPAPAKRVDLRIPSDIRLEIELAAALEGLTLKQWLIAAARLALARGGTR